MDIQRILADQRISVERPYTREWNLHIRKVKLSDSGKFMCIINTSPVQIRTIQLHVV
ncbi:protein amalgam-like isoform x2, partial [Plakobranchus ocellatus]